MPKALCLRRCRSTLFCLCLHYSPSHAELTLGSNVQTCWNVCAEVLKLSSRILPFVNVLGFNSSKMGRRLLPLSPMMVVWTTLKKTYVPSFLPVFSGTLKFFQFSCCWPLTHCRMKCWLLDLVVRDMPWEIFLVSGSRLWRFLVSRSWLFSRRRKRSLDLRLSFLPKYFQAWCNRLLANLVEFVNKQFLILGIVLEFQLFYEVHIYCLKKYVQIKILWSGLLVWVWDFHVEGL